MKRLHIVIASLLSLIAFSGTASESMSTDSMTVVRPVASFFTIEAGSSSMTDTYLSPLTFRGWDFAIAYQRMQAMRFSPQRWVSRFDVGLSMRRGTPPRIYRAMWGASLNIGWAMMHRWSTPVDNLSVAFGGMVDGNFGVLYIDRGGNNPASAKGAVNIGITGAATYNFNLGRLPLTLRWQPSMPLIGAFFSPEYDELYYEIYLGNRSGLVKCANPVSRFALDNAVTLDLHVGASTVIRLGYHSSIMSSHANHLTTNIFTNTFVFGVGGQWLSIGASRGISDDTRIISAIY